MKNASITIQFDEKKLEAARVYAERKGAGLEAELAECIQKLYEKYVPRDAREYIELTSGGLGLRPGPRQSPVKKAPPSTPSVPSGGTAGEAQKG